MFDRVNYLDTAIAPQQPYYKWSIEQYIAIDVEIILSEVKRDSLLTF